MTEPTSSETRSAGDSLFVSEADSLKPLQIVEQIVGTAPDSPWEARLIECAPKLYKVIDEALINTYLDPECSDPPWVKEARYIMEYINSARTYSTVDQRAEPVVFTEMANDLLNQIKVAADELRERLQDWSEQFSETKSAEPMAVVEQCAEISTDPVTGEQYLSAFTSSDMMPGDGPVTMTIDDLVEQETLDQYKQAAKAAADSWGVVDPELRARIEAKFSELRATSAEMISPADIGIISTTSLTPEQQSCRHSFTRTGMRCQTCGAGVREIHAYARSRS